jgi:hypothetical protein
MVTAQESQFIDRVMKIFIGLGAKNVTLSSIPEVSFFMDEIVEGYTAKCAVKCDTEKAWVGRDSIFKFYQAMQSYMPYSGMKRGYYIATGAYMKDSKVKVAEINDEREDFEIILVNSSDLDQYEVKAVSVPVEEPKPQKKKKIKLLQEVPVSSQPIDSISSVALAKPAEVVEQPKQKMQWLAKKSKQPKEAKKSVDIKDNFIVKSLNPVASIVANVFYDIFSGMGSYVTSLTTDMPFEYLLVLIGIICVILIALVILILHNMDAPIHVGGKTIFT